MVIGRILSMSVSHCPSLAKTWSYYAAWCYRHDLIFEILFFVIVYRFFFNGFIIALCRWGRKVVDVASRAGGSLSGLDIVKIKQVLPYETTEAQLEEIIMILSQTRAVADEDNIEAIKKFSCFELVFA